MAKWKLQHVALHGTIEDSSLQSLSMVVTGGWPFQAAASGGTMEPLKGQLQLGSKLNVLL